VSCRWLAIALDALLCLTFLAICAIVVTGGTTVRAARVTIGLHSPDNPLSLLALLLILRYTLREWAPFLGYRGWPLIRIGACARRLTIHANEWLTRLDAASSSRYLAVLAVAAVGVRIGSAWFAPGFYSGDDVEIHEMTLSVLTRTSWPIWDLRSPIFPFLIIYPAQYLAYHVGWTDTTSLVFVGRAVVAVLSGATIWLSFLLARTYLRAPHGYALVAAFLVATNKLQMAFGSSELPRPVATILVVLACLILVNRTRIADAALAGALVAVAASFRFSEAVFLLPAFVQLCLRNEWRRAVVLVACWAVVSLVAAGLGDFVYWGEAFHSFRAAWDYTVVRQLSSRGYQATLWYPLHVTSWTNPAMAVLAVLGTRKHVALSLWAWIPLVVLSALPHKEARYLIPITPFVCVLAVAGLFRVVAYVKERSSGFSEKLAIATLTVVVLGTLQDAGHWRLPRSNAEVALAHAVQLRSPRALAIEQAWRLGGHLYLPTSDIVELDPDALTDVGYVLQRARHHEWILLDTARTRDPDRLLPPGYTELAIPPNQSAYRVWTP
jgi:hypothetical protein